MGDNPYPWPGVGFSEDGVRVGPQWPRGYLCYSLPIYWLSTLSRPDLPQLTFFWSGNCLSRLGAFSLCKVGNRQRSCSCFDIVTSMSHFVSWLHFWPAPYQDWCRSDWRIEFSIYPIPPKHILATKGDWQENPSSIKHPEGVRTEKGRIKRYMILPYHTHALGM